MPVVMQDRELAHQANFTPATSDVDDVGLDQTREWFFPGADEWFRSIYTRAVGAGEAVVVCSAIQGEGKTTVSIGLAATLAGDFPDRRVVLVETDLHHPTLKADFGLEEGPGLANCLEGSPTWQEACRATALPNLDILPAGVATAQAGRLLRSSRMALLIDRLREAYEVVLLDAPALLVNSDAQLLVDMADGAILVVRAGVTPVPLVNKALEQIEEAKLRGVVLNATHSRLPRWLQRLTGA